MGVALLHQRNVSLEITHSATPTLYSYGATCFAIGGKKLRGFPPQANICYEALSVFRAAGENSWDTFSFLHYPTVIF